MVPPTPQSFQCIMCQISGGHSGELDLPSQGSSYVVWTEQNQINMPKATLQNEQELQQCEESLIMCIQLTGTQQHALALGAHILNVTFIVVGTKW